MFRGEVWRLQWKRQVSARQGESSDRSPARLHRRLRLPASRTVRNKFMPRRLRYFASCSPRRLMQRPNHSPSPCSWEPGPVLLSEVTPFSCRSIKDVWFCGPGFVWVQLQDEVYITYAPGCSDSHFNPVKWGTSPHLRGRTRSRKCWNRCGAAGGGNSHANCTLRSRWRKKDLEEKSFLNVGYKIWPCSRGVWGFQGVTMGT